MDTDAIVIGAGLAGLVATAELADAGRKVILLDQEPEASFGGQAWWSLGGLMFVDSPEQRRLRIKDSRELAWQDWLGTAGFDREEDAWPRRWAEAYVDFTAGEKRAWLAGMGVKFMPNVGWAERGGYLATGHGNSVPRFHLTWGTGPGVVEPFERRVREAVARGLVELRFRHKVDELVVSGGAVTGVRGEILEPSGVRRGEKSSRTAVGEFALDAQAVLVTSGGIGANHELVRRNWPQRLGTPPRSMVQGVPDHVDGRMIQIAQDAGGNVINPDRMWHYVEGMRNWDPVWTNHGIRIIPGPSSLWFDALGRRLPAPLFPGFDTLGTLAHIMQTGHEHTWFVLTQKIIEKEFALSGSEQNPDITGRDIKQVLKGRVGSGAPGAGRGVQAARRRLRRRARPGGARARHERADPRAAARRRRARGRDRRPRPRAGEPLRQGPPDRRHPRRPALPRRPHHADRRAAPHPRPRGRPADRGQAAHPHPQDARRAADRPRRPRPAGVGRAAGRALRGRRGGRLRRRRDARLPRARGHVPRRLPVLGAHRGARGCRAPWLDARIIVTRQEGQLHIGGSCT